MEGNADQILEQIREKIVQHIKTEVTVKEYRLLSDD